MMSRRPAAWAAYAVPCPHCGAPPRVPCADPPAQTDPRQTCIPGAGRTRRVPHGERIAAWTGGAR